MTPKVDITTPIMFPIAHKKTPSPPPFITDYKLSYKKLQSCNFSSAHRLQMGLFSRIGPRRPLASLFGKVQVIVEPLARIDALHIEAGGTVGQGRIEDEAPDGGSQNNKGGDPARDERLAAHAFLGRDEPAQTANGPRLGLARGVIHRGECSAGIERLQVKNEFNQCATHHGGGQV